MNTQHLITELTNLSNEAKRRNTEIKHSCDIALTDLKQFTQLDKLSNLPPNAKSQILSPFLISCNVNNARFANLAIPAIHKLILSNAINPQDLNDLLKSLLEATHLAIDIQLRILQCLPSLMQNYNQYIKGDLLLNLLSICSGLTLNNKSTVVINTASATLQQLFNYIYDKIPKTPTNNNQHQLELNGEIINLDDSENEGFLILQDLCKLLDRQPPTYYKEITNIKSLTVLDIIENILSNHIEVFHNHKEINYLTKIKLVPSLLRILNVSREFALVVRVMRVLSVLLNTQLLNLVIEGEIILSTLNHLLISHDESDDSDDWEKILVLETFKHLFINFDSIKTIFELYDFDSKKKNVIQELLSILDSYLTYNPITPTIITGQIQPPPANSIYISKQSSIKISISDHLDKLDPPIVPPTYSINLIFQMLLSLTDGIAKFVSNLSFDNEDLEVKIELINKLIQLIYPNLSQLFEYYLHCLMDNDHFHTLIRTLQKFIHSTGLLGLNSLRDGLLQTLSKVIINTESRKFTSRHITCLRALINLGTSLGSTLTESWKIIWITLQWSDYYINGPDEFSGNHEPKSGQDVDSIDSSIGKFYESIKDYPIESYEYLLGSLIGIFNENITASDVSAQKVTDNDAAEQLPFCTFNKVYFVNKIYEISQINLTKFIITPQIFDSVSKFFIENGINSSLNFNFKSLIISKYTELIKKIADETNNENVDYNQVNLMCLKGLDSLLGHLNEDKSLTLNNRIDIHLEVLNTLDGMIEKYDKRLIHPEIWDIIFIMINSGFNLNLGDKVSSIINSCFNCLKLIMNELITILPLTKFKILIDTLYNFCTQVYDLNISFSSISYFWMISDSLKSKVKDGDNEVGEDISNLGELDSIFNDNSKAGDLNAISLDIYLLLQIIKLSHDDRAQVRDGSLQTFFEIIEIHGELFSKNHWSIIYDVIFNKIFQVKDLPVTELKETVKLKLDGMISIYTKFNEPLGNEIWKKLIQFNTDLIALHKIEINIIVLSKFQELLKANINKEILLMIYNFWIEFPVDYEFSDVDSYLDELNNLVIIFPLIYAKLVSFSMIDGEKISQILTSFTKILRYPIIIHKLDDDTPTILQKNIMDNVRLIIQDNNDEVNSIIIRELSNLLIYQFKIREKIENKLMNSNLKSKYKLPTFISISKISMELIELTWTKINDFNIIINDGTMIKMMKSLLEVNENKATNWIKCNEFLLVVIEKFLTNNVSSKQIWNLIIDCIEVNFQTHNQQEENINVIQYSKLISLVSPYLSKGHIVDQLIRDIYRNSYLYEFNEIDMELLGKEQGQQDQQDQQEQQDCEEDKKDEFKEDFDKTINNLTQYDFNATFGITRPIEFYKFKKMKLICLEQLIKYTVEGSLGKEYFKYFIARISFSLRRIIEEVNLVYKSPINSMQILELRLLLDGLLDYLNRYYDGSNYGFLKKVEVLLIKLDVECFRGVVREVLLKIANSDSS